MNLQDYELLYDLPAGEYDGRGIAGIRTVTIRAGASLEVMCHPIIRHWPEGAKREAKSRKTGRAMEAINARNQTLHIMRLAELNFHHLKAMVLTGTFEYPGENDVGLMNIDDVWDDWRRRKLPESVEDVRKIVRNFLGRVKRRMEDPKALKWILRIEEDDKLSAFGLPTRYHVHMLIEAGNLTQDDVSMQWPFGFTRCDRFDLIHDGAARIARYITKNKRGGRWISHSRNLKKPVPRVSDRKLSRRRAARIASEAMYEGQKEFERVFNEYRMKKDPDSTQLYRVKEMRVTYSDYMPGAYFYCRMRLEDNIKSPQMRIKKP